MVVDVPESTAGKVIELVTQRKGELTIMEPKGDLQHLEFNIPARGLIGLRNNILTATAGEAIMNLTKVASFRKPAGFFNPENPADLRPVKPAKGKKPEHAVGASARGSWRRA
mgnify:CR=1 FL=1